MLFIYLTFTFLCYISSKFNSQSWLRQGQPEDKQIDVNLFEGHEPREHWIEILEPYKRFTYRETVGDLKKFLLSIEPNE